MIKNQWQLIINFACQLSLPDVNGGQLLIQSLVNKDQFQVGQLLRKCRFYLSVVNVTELLI